MCVAGVTWSGAEPGSCLVLWLLLTDFTCAPCCAHPAVRVCVCTECGPTLGRDPWRAPTGWLCLPCPSPGVLAPEGKATSKALPDVPSQPPSMLSAPGGPRSISSFPSRPGDSELLGAPDWNPWGTSPCWTLPGHPPDLACWVWFSLGHSLPGLLWAALPHTHDQPCRDRVAPSPVPKCSTWLLRLVFRKGVLQAPCGLCRRTAWVRPRITLDHGQ